MKPTWLKSYLQPNTAQLGKYVFLIVLYSFISPFVSAQNRSTAMATISAVVITDVIGADDFKSMEFANIKATSNDQMVKSTLLNNSAASFNVISSSLYFITLPANDILVSIKGSADSMNVGSFKIISTPESLNATGHHVNIGATLKINPFQPPGLYCSNTPLRVTINYN